MAGRDDGRNPAPMAAIAVAVVLALVVVVGVVAWWWFAPTVTRVVVSPSQARERPGEAAPFPEPVDAVAREREVKAPAAKEEEAGGGKTEVASEGAAAAEPRIARPLGDRHGRLVAASTKEPIAGAAIVAVRAELDADDSISFWLRLARAKERARSGADGRFTIVDLRDDEALVVLAPRWAATAIRMEQLTVGSADAVACEVREGARLTGRATGRDGTPVEGARATMRSMPMIEVGGWSGAPASATARFPRFEFAATTDAKGEVVIESLIPWAEHSLQLDPPASFASDEAARAKLRRVEPGSLRLSPGETVVRQWRLGGGVTLRGRLLDEAGLPLADALVWLMLRDPVHDDATADRRRFLMEDESRVVAHDFTDDEGRFEFEEQPAGQFWVGPAPWSRTSVGHAAHSLVPDAVAIELREGEVAREIELHARRGLYVSGRAVDRRGSGVPGWIEAEPGPARVHVDDEGYFRVGPLAPGDQLLRMTPQSASYAPPASTTVAAGARDVRLDVPDGARLEVRCTAPDGPLVVASLVVVPLDGAGERTAWLGGRGLGGESDDSIEGLPAGRYSVGATSAEGLAGVVDSIELAEGETKRVTLSLSLAAFLDLRLADASLDRATVSLSCGGRIVAVREVARGATLHCPVLPGVVRVRATVGAATLARDVEVAAGERREVVVDER